VDLGAESGRVIVGTLPGGRVKLEQVHRFANIPVRTPDGVHWNVLGLYGEILQGLHAAASIYGDAIAGIGIDSWAVDYGLVDAAGRLLGIPYHYRDARTDGVRDTVAQRVPPAEHYTRTGIAQLPFNTLYQLFAAQRNSTRLLAAADRLLTIPDLLNYWLTGSAVCEWTNATTTQLADAYYQRGLVYLDKAGKDIGQALPFLDKAMADFTTAIRLDPKSDVPYQNRGRAWARKKQYDKAIADFEGISVHCAKNSPICAQNAKPDLLPHEPGGYVGFSALFGNKNVAPQVNHGQASVNDLDGHVIADDQGNVGFPGFDPTASQTLGYLATMLEAGVPVVYFYIEDAHDNHNYPGSPTNPDGTFGPGVIPCHSANAAAQRVPLPEISGSLPSELNNRVRSPAPSFATSIQPSAPIPVVRAQIRRATSGRLSLGASPAHVSRKSFSAPCSFVNGISITSRSASESLPA